VVLLFSVGKTAEYEVQKKSEGLAVVVMDCEK
jgi:hypothetical protein